VFRGIAPNRTSRRQALPDDRIRLPQPQWYVLEYMHAVADEKRHHHQVARPGETITFLDARRFFEEQSFDRRIGSKGADESDLPFDRQA
jgi:hypothetical protein